MEVIVGTAGHIDHGKTALVKALTGVDADRLPEEKDRGITIDIGFADLSIGDVHIGFVDVPGHERFVKNMLAGASGIDLLLLVVDAGEGVMPQTREHFEICRLLGIGSGVVALTKTDVADEETIELARLDVADLVAGSFLEAAPVIPVSARSGAGIDDLKTALLDTAHRLATREDRLIARLPVDRSFTMKGFGSVVTGTLASGVLNEGDELDLLPVGRRVRVRGLQTHNRTVASAAAGQRVAVNLGGIDHSEVTRGMLLAKPGVLRPTQMIDASIEVLGDAARPVRSRQRVRVHIGTVEALGRIYVLNGQGEIAPGAGGFVQLRLESPVTAVMGERFIIRSYSPQVTIAGGAVLDNAGTKFRARDMAATVSYLERLSAATEDTQRVALYVETAGAGGLTVTDLQARTGLKADLLAAAVEAAVKGGAIAPALDRFIAAGAAEELARATALYINEFHKREPLARGVPREELRDALFAHLPDEVFQSVLSSLSSAGKVTADKDVFRSAAHNAELSPGEKLASDRILNAYLAAGLQVAKADEVLAAAAVDSGLSAAQVQKLFRQHVETGRIVKAADEFYFARQTLDALVDMLKQHAASSPDRLIDVPTFKDLAGISRKYAIPLLEYLDREHVTARAGDKRVIL
jgi:selenocysteine-specific elongation factor